MKVVIEKKKNRDPVFQYIIMVVYVVDSISNFMSIGKKGSKIKGEERFSFSTAISLNMSCVH